VKGDGLSAQPYGTELDGADLSRPRWITQVQDLDAGSNLADHIEPLPARIVRDWSLSGRRAEEAAAIRAEQGNPDRRLVARKAYWKCKLGLCGTGNETCGPDGNNEEGEAEILRHEADS
jgi:hypothetical protein